MKDWFTIQKAVGVHIADVSELRPCTNVSIKTAAMARHFTTEPISTQGIPCDAKHDRWDVSENNVE